MSNDNILKGITARKRVEYIDALRGTVMFLVVSHHVSNLCFHVFGSRQAIDDYIWQYLIPTFFFISGFVMNKDDSDWSIGHIMTFLKKKLHLLVLAPIVFFLLNIHVFHKDILECLFSDTKGGYWFTFVLFGFFVLYALIRYAVRNSRWVDYVLLIVGACMYLSC